MYENYKQMTAEQQAEVKAIHEAFRAQVHSRYGNLAWAFVRGFTYRRVERTTRTQTMPDGTLVEHNPPSAAWVTYMIGLCCHGFAQIDSGRAWATKAAPEVQAWLKDPSGAIPAPAPREKQLFIRSEVA